MFLLLFKSIILSQLQSVHILNRLFFRQFYVYRKINTKVQSPHIPPLVPHSFSYDLHCILFGTFVTTDEPISSVQFSRSVESDSLRPHINILHVKVYPSLQTFFGFDKCIMTCIHHYTIAQNSYIALCSTSSSIPPLELLIFLLFLYLYFSQKVIQLESHSMQPFQIGFFHLVMCFLSFMHVFL